MTDSEEQLSDRRAPVAVAGAPPVMAIVTSWNRREKLLSCVGSLLRSDHPNLEIVVVDNASADDSVSALRNTSPTVVVLENESNLGFTGGVNRGLRFAADAGARYAFVLNDDAEVDPECIRLLVETAETHDAAVVGPSVYFADRRDVFWSAGGRLDGADGMATLIGCGEVDRGQFGHGVHAVDFVGGCAFLVRLDVVATVGLLDERFFAYYEEVEWSVRARRDRHRILYEPRARAWHDVRLEEQARSQRHCYYMTRNRLLYMKLTGAPWWARGRVVVGEHLRTVIAWTLRSRWRDRRHQRRFLMRGVVDYYLGRFGGATFEMRGPLR